MRKTDKYIPLRTANIFVKNGTAVGDVAQIYADGELVADDYYYGKTWRVPCKLLYGKECYMVISEMKDDFYKEF